MRFGAFYFSMTGAICPLPASLQDKSPPFPRFSQRLTFVEHGVHSPMNVKESGPFGVSERPQAGKNDTCSREVKFCSRGPKTACAPDAMADRMYHE